MLNAEKYRDEILEIAKSNGLLSFDLSKNTVSRCNDTPCHNCLFKGNCNVKQYEWLLSEYKKPILDGMEREYLSKVCEPYEIVSITKQAAFDNKFEWIVIEISSSIYKKCQFINLPYFKVESMYKGMKTERKYMSQELGIKCKNNPNGEIKYG